MKGAGKLKRKWTWLHINNDDIIIALTPKVPPPLTSLIVSTRFRELELGPSRAFL